ncbi:Phytosulfokine receptor 2 [Raphanus sativus]|nr:Phytosulfokine receptor 2 [Raphanus sativus]
MMSKGSSRSHDNNNGKFGRSSIVVLAISLALGITLLLSVILLRLSRKDADDRVNDVDEEAPLSSSSSKIVLFHSCGCKDLTVADLLKSTNSFSQANIIGCGGFGLVYKSNLPDGSKAAVKKLSGDCGQMEREFQAEVEALSRAEHKNLVSLQGYCKHGSDRLLIYSFMETGSLDYWLHESSTALRWEVRLKIAQGAARGLAYLHKAEKREAEIIDATIREEDVEEEEVLEVLEIACKCIDHDPRRRPLIEDVVAWLEDFPVESVEEE